MINDTTTYDPGWWNLAASCDWRGDGYWWTVTEKYTPYCTLTVRVVDLDSTPVDGARVAIQGGPQPVTWFCAFAYTDKNGKASFTLGDVNNYDAEVESNLGNISFTRVINQALAHTHYRQTFMLSGHMPHLRLVNDTFPHNPLNRYKVQISFQAQNEIIYGVHPDDNSLFAQRGSLGTMNFFICDSINFLHYLQGDNIRAFLISRDITDLDTSFVFPTDKPHYLIFSNDERIGNGVDLSAYIKLYRGAVGIQEEESHPKNKGEGSIFLNKSFTLNDKMKVFDITGKAVTNPNKLSNGIYFIKSKQGEFKKIVLK
jgi:hypothetical protein